MKEWFSARELAGLPGVRESESGLIRCAKKKEWKARKRQAKGGGREYHINSLPPETQQHLRRQQAIAAVNAMSAEEREQEETTRLQALKRAGEALGEREFSRVEGENNARLKVKEQSLKEFTALPDGPRKTRAKARKWVIEAIWIYRRTHGGTKQSSRATFAEQFNQGLIETPQWVQDLMPRYHNTHTLTAASLHRWEDNYLNKGIMALVDSYGQNKGRSKIECNDTLKKIVLGSIFKYPHITGKKIKAYIEADHQDLDIVSIKGIDRYISAWKADNAQLWTKITNPDKWKNIYMAAVGSHHDQILRLNQLWEMDSTPGD